MAESSTDIILGAIAELRAHVDLRLSQEIARVESRIAAVPPAA